MKAGHVLQQKKSLLMYLNWQGREIFTTLEFKEGDVDVPEERTLALINTAFKGYCEPRKSIFIDGKFPEKRTRGG